MNKETLARAKELEKTFNRWSSLCHITSEDGGAIGTPIAVQARSTLSFVRTGATTQQTCKTYRHGSMVR